MTWVLVLLVLGSPPQLDLSLTFQTASECRKVAGDLESRGGDQISALCVQQVTPRPAEHGTLLLLPGGEQQIPLKGDVVMPLTTSQGK